MAVSDWSTDPTKNLKIDGVDIAEGCDAGNLNDAVRRVMAAVKALSDSLTEVDAMPISGGEFTGQIKRKGRGGYLHNAPSDSTGGAIYVITAGSALPKSLTNGDFVVEIA
jgi:hypothetical protein